MIGTEKQIKWANDIKNSLMSDLILRKQELIDALNKNIQKSDDRISITSNSMYFHSKQYGYQPSSHTRSLRKNTIKFMIFFIEKIIENNNAKTWIENRDELKKLFSNDRFGEDAPYYYDLLYREDGGINNIVKQFLEDDKESLIKNRDILPEWLIGTDFFRGQIDLDK